MSDVSGPLRLEIVGVRRNGRRCYDPASKQRLVEACLQAGASLSGLAVRHGVNANLLRKWVAEQRRQQSDDVAVDTRVRATEVFLPVVELCGVAGEPPAVPSVQPAIFPAQAARALDPPLPKLTVEMPNGITLRLECSVQDAALVSAMIVTLGRCDVPARR